MGQLPKFNTKKLWRKTKFILLSRTSKRRCDREKLAVLDFMKIPNEILVTNAGYI